MLLLLRSRASIGAVCVGVVDVDKYLVRWTHFGFGSFAFGSFSASRSQLVLMTSPSRHYYRHLPAICAVSFVVVSSSLPYRGIVQMLGTDLSRLFLCPSSVGRLHRSNLRGTMT